MSKPELTQRVTKEGVVHGTMAMMTARRMGFILGELGGGVIVALEEEDGGVSLLDEGVVAGGL